MPISGKIAYQCARFPYEEGVIDSDVGTCVYENGEVKLAYHRLWSPRWSKDGRKLTGGFLQSQENGLGILDYPETEHLPVQTGFVMSEFSFFPDGKKITFAGFTQTKEQVSPQNVYLYDLESASLKQLTDFKKRRGASLHSVDLSPDGRTIAFSRYSWNQNKTFLTLIGVNGSEIETLPFEGDDVRFSPDGNKLTFVSPYYGGRRRQGMLLKSH
jgi:Tol biopolymer transport system component